MSRIAYHPTHPGWGRFRVALRDLDRVDGDPEALSGLDDIDEDVLAELPPARVRDPHTTGTRE